MRIRGPILQALTFIAFFTMVTVSDFVRSDIETTVTYYHSNFSGSPVAATSQSGAPLWNSDYLPYGKRYNTSQGADNDVWFTGHVEDEPSGLVYMQARYYDPDIGRFHGIDSVGFVESNPMSFNRYAYANNNPYKYVDPDGRDIVSADQKYNAQLGADINNLASGIFKFNNANSLEVVSLKGGKGHSDAYTKALVSGIQQKPTLTIHVDT